MVLDTELILLGSALVPLRPATVHFTALACNGGVALSRHWATIEDLSATCKLCEKKKARRYCPASAGEICPSCCGVERENSIDCPLDCEYLMEARKHERPIELAESDFPYPEVEVTESFIRQQEPLVMWVSLNTLLAATKQNACDSDAREALAAMIQTYRTKSSGLIYQSRPANPYAAAIQDKVAQSLAEMEQRARTEVPGFTLRDADVLGVLVFLDRLAAQYSNGRRRGRSFLDFLRVSFPPPEHIRAMAEASQAERASPLADPSAGRLII